MDRDLFRLGHIHECADKIEQLVERLQTFENFKQSWIEQDSMLRNFEIIGEASNHISDIVKERFPEVEWFKIRGMRNLVAHEYFGVRLETIWETATVNIPVLKKQVQEIIDSLES
tara:strand:+ start:481 stop:825 length:345 start_codon:yes stop_codon:yes gene_type:complete